MKKFAGIVLSAMLAVSCLAGCGKSDGFDASKSISMITREQGSGTRGAFIELFGIEQKDESGNKVDYTTKEALIQNNTNAVLTAVAGDVYAVGYVSLGSLNDTVKAVKIDGAEATVDNIKNGSYTIQRPFNIATKGEVSEAAQDFIDYIMSAEGQKVIEDNGYISAAEGEAYTASGLSGKIVVSGSSSVTPVMEKLKEAYIALNPDVSIEVQEHDSTAGMNDTIEGVCDIGMASREVKDSEKEAGLQELTIAIDGLAVIVNKDCPIENLTKDQIKGIYTGTVTSWKEVQ